MSNLLARLDNITAGYNGEPVLKGVSLDIRENDFIGIIGPNGGGKTTMLKVLLGILEPFRGRVDFPGGKINIGYLPQASQIDRSFPISVKEVVEAGLKPIRAWSHHLSKAQKESAYKLLTEAGMERYYKKPIGELSGGQLQKVLLCRAIVSNPALLVLDEPNTYVDKHFESELHQWLKKLNKNMAIVLVSHDVGTIPSLVKSIACVNGTLHYHPSNQLTTELLKVYDCPIDLISHGHVPHRVLKNH
ncbi:metal ABC transporter ATP-binding protein [Alkalitalea saponilacus]|uniref:Zinc transport system ATP-binding protein n=1 Tax=Alkalitalea saponilacus TaxID=889453 RepID=A0A1T5A5J4_9BACT|nr:metal ABC transporter ATP-binding protein [Alkalitalea saponilacus]ASB48840.1 zinc ABC transporter ATP-binding protein [Alkalitalea saponilacus]SKB30254.1 zinc transport system ATP-binding protein [Alkalitalea saponilacus]